MVLAFLWGSFLLWRHVSLTSYKEESVFDGIFISLFGGLFVGRILFVLFNFDEFGFNPLKFVLVNGYPGMSAIGLIGGFFMTLYLFCAWNKYSFFKLVDYVIAPFFLALAIVKLGSFFSGSEIGTQTKFFISLKYPSLDGARHLTPLYESILFFVGAYLAHQIMKRVRREKYTEGFNLMFFLWYYGLVSALADPITSFKTVLHGYSFQLIISLFMLLTVSIYFIYYFRASLFNKPFRFMKKKKK